MHDTAVCCTCVLPAGEKLCEKPFEILFEASWMPPLPGTTYEDRPPSPERLAAAPSSNGAAGGAGAAGAAGGAAGQSKGAYRCADGVCACAFASALITMVLYS
jgi:hypothetical protein